VRVSVRLPRDSRAVATARASEWLCAHLQGADDIHGPSHVIHEVLWAAEEAARVVQIERARTHYRQPLSRPLEGERVVRDLRRAREVGLVLPGPLPARARRSGSRGTGRRAQEGWRLRSSGDGIGHIGRQISSSGHHDRHSPKDALVRKRTPAHVILHPVRTRGNCADRGYTASLARSLASSRRTFTCSTN
jgi:hypothetical protein